MTSQQNFNIVSGDIFQFTDGLLVIPVSAEGTISESFEIGLAKHEIIFNGEQSAIGDVRFIWGGIKSLPNLHLAYVTTVTNYSSDYKTIATISKQLSDGITGHDVRFINCPLLGAGSGGLYAVYAAILIALPILKKQVILNLVVYEKEHLKEIGELQEMNYHSLVRKFIEEITISLRDDQSFVGIINWKDFYFDLAQQVLHELENTKIPNNRTIELLAEFKEFSGNFQEFINGLKATEEIEFFHKIGELITYLDSQAYNKNSWNRYSDKRTVARAGVWQPDWVKNILEYLISQTVDELPFNIRNALAYLIDPLKRVPVLSREDRVNILASFFEEKIEVKEFDSVITSYFSVFPYTNPVNRANLTLLISRAIYHPLIRLIWDPIVIKQGKVGKDSLNSGSQEDTTADPGEINNNNKKGKSLKAKLHDDRYSDVDLLNYELYAQTIVNFIRHRDTKPPLTIGIYAPWGMGKTTLMRFIEKKLNSDQISVNKDNDDIGSIIKATIWSKLSSIFQKVIQSVGVQKNDAKKSEVTKEDPGISIRQILEDLKKPPFSRKYGKKKYPSVWFNAWKFDNTEQIFSGLAHEIIKQLVEKLPNQVEKERFYFELNRKRFDGQKMASELRIHLYKAVFNKLSIFFLCAGVIAYLFVREIFSFDTFAPFYIGGFLASVKSCIDYVKEKTKSASTYLSKFVRQPNYEDKLGFFHEVEEDLRSVFEKLVDDDDPCVIFIDDLDRCSSKKVVEVIEAINLFINGDFPNCYFVIGMDAQMVAASIEACYSDVDKKLNNVQRAHGSLGWYFMEKFVQLQFVIPNLSKDTGRAFLKKLLEEENENVEANAAEVQELKNKVHNVNLTDKQSVDELSQQLEKISATHKTEVKEIKATLIDRASKELEDSEKDAAVFLEQYSQYLNVSPRVIKRFANLFRFYRFMQIPNLTSKLRDLEEHEIAEMVILTLRWPQLPRLIQWNNSTEFVSGNNALDRASSLDDRFANGSIPLSNSSEQWLQDEDLKSFILTRGIKLKRYVEVGVW